MRSYVVKRLPHFRHSRRRRMESASLLSRESTTLSFANPQKGHFMGLIAELVIVAGRLAIFSTPLGGTVSSSVLSQVYQFYFLNPLSCEPYVAESPCVRTHRSAVVRHLLRLAIRVTITQP